MTQAPHERESKVLATPHGMARDCCPPNKTCRVQDRLGPSFLQSNYTSRSHASCNIKFVAGTLSAHVVAGLDRSTAISNIQIRCSETTSQKILQIQSHIFMLPRVWHLKIFPTKITFFLALIILRKNAHIVKHMHTSHTRCFFAYFRIYVSFCIDMKIDM